MAAASKRGTARGSIGSCDATTPGSHAAGSSIGSHRGRRASAFALGKPKNPNEGHISLAGQKWDVQTYCTAPISLSACSVSQRHETVALVAPEHGSVFCVDDSFSNEPRLQIRTETTGTPSAVVFDATGSMYVCDLKNKCVLIQPTNPWNDKQGSLDILVYDYEGHPLQGPRAATVDEHTGTLYFTDAGPFGATGMHNAKGSLFCIVDDMLQPIAHECLAYPWGVALSADGSVVFVAETMRNRVLRYAQGSEGSWRSMVLWQGSGGVGPSVLCTDRDGNLYVAMYNTINHCNKKAAAKQLGKVLVLDADTGVVKEVIALPMPNITGIAACSTQTRPTLYITADKTLYKLEYEQDEPQDNEDPYYA